ncbi:helix-turn-helix transcriptional regulator [Sphingopyxis sp. UBA6734]|jgi:AraC-like DNA-binding protein|uniref:helix-turn-helix transcriptional regulator n=1 Tax=Sphingopyxis sp. UBA6734 TaxID=1947539 RepID=UPI0008B03A6E|nr:AraC family transcriptional regulator [Sphingopyxis sp. UBA6734]OHD04182.1 MAG: hypothetical protein A2885_19410 [Sphingopyxis sp. RIFCSPHIGHO2_01_FULL_65_24]
MTVTPDWKGRLQFGDYIARWSGSVGDAVPHQHFAAQAVIANEPIMVTDGAGRQFASRCLLIEPDAVHCLHPAHDVELWYIEPTVRFGPPNDLETRLRHAGTIHVVGEGSGRFWPTWLAREPRGALDGRIVAAAKMIDLALATGSVRLADAAQESGLSLGRFRHLFTAEVGMPFQRYVLWRRLLVAFEALHAGRNVTDAAHAAGFSDSAHLARTIKAMFGIRASDLDFTA